MKSLHRYKHHWTNIHLVIPGLVANNVSICFQCLVLCQDALHSFWLPEMNKQLMLGWLSLRVLATWEQSGSKLKSPFRDLELLISKKSGSGMVKVPMYSEMYVGK